MSGSEDPPPPTTRRGRLPRSNLPRPTHARRPGERDKDGGERRIDPASEREAASIRPTEPAAAAETAGPADAATLKQGAAEGALEAPAERAPHSAGAQPAPRNTATRRDAAERPTTKVEAPDAPTGELRRATLLRAGSDASEATVAPNAYIGCIIDGRYRIDAVIGRGGMGVVYRARHQIIDKLVAIKILLPTEDLDVVTRFVNEARAATSIGNPHIVDTIDFGRLPDESTYFAMEYLEGQTLAQVIKESGHLALHRAIAVAKQIAEGMSAAHDADIVHRDLKPENVFITVHGKQHDFVKLLDFGIAKVASAQNRITRAGTIFGTPHYMSPEQAAGTEVDHRSDIYSLGVMLYEMVSGRTPFEAENTMGLLTQHMYTQPTPLGDLKDPPQVIPVQVDAIVLKCLSKRPDERYASMRDVIDDLERVEQGRNPAALADLLARADDEKLTGVRAAAKAATGRSRPRLWVVAAVALLGGAGLVAVGRSATERPLPVAIDSRGKPLPSSTASAVMEVSLVFSPIDAEVFRGNASLGGMPVAIAVEPNQAVSVVIKRDGFYPEPVTIDGSRRVVVVRLREIPGAEPAIPVPDDEPLERFAEEHELDMSRMLLGAADAGVGHRRVADAGARHTVERHPDAGSPRHKAAHPVPTPPALPPGASSSLATPKEPPPSGPSEPERSKEPTDNGP